MKTTTARLIRTLAGERVQPVSITTRTPADMRRGGGRFGPANPLIERGVIRLARRGGFIGASYASVVNRQREREGRPLAADGSLETFRAEKLWRGHGEHVRGNRHLVRHKVSGLLYLVFFPSTDKAGKPVVARSEFRWADTDETIPDETVRPWLKLSGVSGRQGTKKQVPWRLFMLEHLVQMKLGGRLYEITDGAVSKKQSASSDAADISQAITAPIGA